MTVSIYNPQTGSVILLGFVFVIVKTRACARLSLSGSIIWPILYKKSAQKHRVSAGNE